MLALAHTHTLTHSQLVRVCFNVYYKIDLQLQFRRRRRLRCGLFCFNYACVLYCRKEFVDCQWEHNL